VQWTGGIGESLDGLPDHIPDAADLEGAGRLEKVKLCKDLASSGC